MASVQAHWRAAALAVLLALPGCGSGEPVGRLQVRPAALLLGHGEAATLRLTWEPARPLDKVRGTPTAFVHLVHPLEGVVRTFDHPLPERWVPGSTVAYDLHIDLSILAEPLPAGNYRLGAGLYDQASGYRWPLETAAEDLDRREYAVATVEVAGADGGQDFSFHGGWGKVEKGHTKQIVAWRWLRGPGSIRVRHPEAGGSIRLAARVGVMPDGAGGLPSTSMAVTGDCGPASPPAGAEGSTPIRVALAPEAAGACTVRLTPRAGDEDDAWVRLDSLARLSR